MVLVWMDCLSAATGWLLPVLIKLCQTSLMRYYFLIIFGESDSSVWPCVKLKFPFRQFLIYSGSPWKQGNLVYAYAAAANVTSALTHAKSTLRGKHSESTLIQTCSSVPEAKQWRETRKAAKNKLWCSTRIIKIYRSKVSEPWSKQTVPSFLRLPLQDQQLFCCMSTNRWRGSETFLGFGGTWEICTRFD